MIKFKTISVFLLGILCVFHSSVMAAKGDSFLFGQEKSIHIQVNNRILAMVNGKPITLYDVMKKMDVIFLKQFPEYAESLAARYQFYQINWKHVLQELIDKDLILADAEENKINVTNGDVRQEMEFLFGPNIIASLDQVGMSYEDAFKIVQGDIVLRRMMYLRVQGKAMRSITPQVIREAYEGYSKENAQSDRWVYYVVAIRDKDTKKAQRIADKAYHLLTEENQPLDGLNGKLNELQELSSISNYSLSEKFILPSNEVSQAYKDVLSALKPGEYSKPQTQKSRAAAGSVVRIFYLEDVLPGGVEAFSEVQNRLRDKLTENAIEIETESYLKKLRSHFDVIDYTANGQLGEDFQAFVTY